MNRSFSELLADAIAGNHEAVEDILEMYAPLINRHSIINERIDEDCRQYILMRVAIWLREFEI